MIHPDRLRSNIRRLADTNPYAQVYAVIKANAYGHGIEQIYSGLDAAAGVALLDLAEARRLRALGWQKPIILLEGAFSAQDWAPIVALRIDPVVHHAEQIRTMQSFVTAAAPIDTVYFKINTGMNRLGFSPDAAFDAFAALDTLRAQQCLRRVVLMTHYANADLGPGRDAQGPGIDAAWQWQALQSLRRRLLAAFPQSLPLPLSAGNSATLLHHADKVGDIGRAGIAIYGAQATRSPAATQGLQPVMQLQSELIGVQQVKQGEYVGYGSRWRADADTRVGIVACGYADGYPRHAPDGTPVLVDGRRCGIVGRVSMDMVIVDLRPVPQARVGSPVVLWGDGLAVDEVAQACGTIGYELLCAVAARVPFTVVENP
ncbi:MAG: alanine racemase [Burkholderiaceae bacterium]